MVKDLTIVKHLSLFRAKARSLNLGTDFQDKGASFALLVNVQTVLNEVTDRTAKVNLFLSECADTKQL